MATKYYFDIIGPTSYLKVQSKTNEIEMSEIARLFAERVCELDQIEDFKAANDALVKIVKKGKSFFNNSKKGYYKEPIKLYNNKGTIYFNKNIWHHDKNWPELESFLKKNNKYIVIRPHSTNQSPQSKDISKQDSVLQVIYYGAPGTGKSFKINKDLKDQIIYRTTFHPDTDYATFVGCYKPDMDKDNNIIYSFIPQIFIKAYLRAWEEYIKGTNRPKSLTSEEKDVLNKEGEKYNHVYLVIEEINRGGCAQIFGDIFQLLDRDDNGWSQYVIIPDQDIAKYLKDKAFPKKSVCFNDYKKRIKKYYEERDKNKENVFKVKIEENENYLSLPPNFHIWATMNTSDQSLFPMDSAFKRRWDWEYVPINPKLEEVKDLKILVKNNEYGYPDFLNKINSKIKSDLKSADKQIGEFFVRSKGENVITFKDFRDKILFYLFNDVFKDNDKFGKEFTNGNDVFLFEDLFSMDDNKQEEVVANWLKNLLDPISSDSSSNEQDLDNSANSDQTSNGSIVEETESGDE